MVQLPMCVLRYKAINRNKNNTHLGVIVCQLQADSLPSPRFKKQKERKTHKIRTFFFVSVFFKLHKPNLK